MTSTVLRLKRGAAWGLERAGLPRLMRSFQRGRGAILMYHRVNDAGDPFFPALPSMVFEEQVDFVRRAYRVEPLEDVVRWLRAGAPGRPRVAVTIDDGYQDTFDVAFPLLRRMGVPATLFLSTGPVDAGAPLWLDHLRALFKGTPVKAFACRTLGLAEARIETASDRLAAMKRLRAILKQVGRKTVDEAIAELAERLDPERSITLPTSLTWAQVKEMAAGGIQIGAHTHKHYVLSRLDRTEAREEIGRSVRLIEEKLGTTVSTFAYPNGAASDYTPVTKALLAEMGLLAACSTRYGFARPGGDPFELPRLETSERWLPLFACHMAGITRKQTAIYHSGALPPGPFHAAEAT
jgi:peptidoglycan/xylan/chitin deacetylase (PgdA/CDA1 family)